MFPWKMMGTWRLNQQKCGFIMIYGEMNLTKQLTAHIIQDDATYTELVDGVYDQFTTLGISLVSNNFMGV